MKTALPLLALSLALGACDGSPEQIASDIGNRAEKAAGDIGNAAADVAGSEVVETINSTAANVIDDFTAVPADAWIGKWVGVEGLVLDIRAGEAPATYTLDITLMDGSNSYDGRAEGDHIAFTRDGKPETIRKATGAQTGLKWLADKKDCLVIRPGEGFCRG